jgi:hypothetical protein
MRSVIVLSFYLNSGVEPIGLASATRVPVTATRSAIFNSATIPTTSDFVSTPTTQLAMSITEAEQRCNVLRNDLKIWEKSFAAQNNGRKAGRDDIKANEEICTHATTHFVEVL